MYLRSMLVLVIFAVHMHTVEAAARKSLTHELLMLAQPSSSHVVQESESDGLEQARQGITYMRQGSPDEGRKCFAEVLQSGDITARNKVGRWYFKQQDYGVATLYFQQAGSGVYGGYESACAWSNLGVAYIKLKNYERAGECLERASMLFDGIQNKDAVDVQQSSLLTTFNLGLVHWYKGAEYDAWNCWGKVAQHSYSLDALQVIAGVLLKNGTFDDAQRVLRRINQMKDVPDAVRAVVANNLGVIAYKKLQVAQAKRYFERAHALGHPAAQENLRLLRNHTVQKGWCSYL